MISAEKGGPPDTWGVESTEEIYKLYKSKLNLIKDCGESSGCFVHKIIGLNGIETSWDGKSEHRNFNLVNGMNIDINFFSSNFANHSSGTYNYGCNINVDVNGNKLPNKIGKDFFTFILTPKGIVPAGCDYEACSGYGYGCTCRILKNKKWMEN